MKDLIATSEEIQSLIGKFSNRENQEQFEQRIENSKLITNKISQNIINKQRKHYNKMRMNNLIRYISGALLGIGSVACYMGVERTLAIILMTLMTVFIMIDSKLFTKW